MGTDSIMNLATLAILLAIVSVTVTRSQETEISAKGPEVGSPPVKLDKNLRRALLKALADLEAESAEENRDEGEVTPLRNVEAILENVSKKNLNNDLSVQKSTFSFKDFPGDEEVPSEDKLQNSSFVETVRYVTLKTPSMNIEKAGQEEARSFHVQNVVLPEANAAMKSEAKREQSEMKSATFSGKSYSVNKVESITFKPTIQASESLAGSASSGIATANALVAPKTTVPSPTLASKSNLTVHNDGKEKSEEVKIFQAPLVAAFTVQQDELGVPKSVVPIYKSSGDGQALTLQEQLEFKQQLLEKQLADLQQQQIQQTQFLIRQRQAYEQQARQKQQQYYIQEQARIKQLEEQARLKQLEEQARLKRIEEQRLKQLEEQRFKQLEDQRIYRFQQQHNIPQKQHFFEQSNNIIPLQPPVDSNVHLQPSVSLEVPNVAAPPPFQVNFQEQLHLQQLRQQQQQQQQQSQQQQRLQQSFGSFSTDFQPPLPSTTRFNRQEAFNSVGNFGFNVENKPTTTRNNFGFNIGPRPNLNLYNPYTHNQFRPTKPPTPAKQIQHLLYQSGVAHNLGNVQGPGNPEDINIVSKVLALNVGALSNKNVQYATNNRGLLAKSSE